MKKKTLTVLALMLNLSVFAQDIASIAVPDVNLFLNKTVAVFTDGKQFDYDEDKRVLSLSGNQAAMIAESNKELLTTMVSWYGAEVLSENDPSYFELQQVINAMSSDADFSIVQKKASSLKVDYILFANLDWLMYLDQLYVHEYQMKSLDVANGIVDRWSDSFYINAMQDYDVDAASARVSNSTIDAFKEMCSRITPRLYGITNVGKNGRQIDMLSITFSGYYQNDVINVYELEAISQSLDGADKTFIIANPIAQSTSIENDGPEYHVTLNNSVEFSPSLIAIAAPYANSDIIGAQYSYVPIFVEPLEEANDFSYSNKVKDRVNYALYTVIHQNRMLKVVADSDNGVVRPKYTVRLSEYSENKNITKFRLSILDYESGDVLGEHYIESHISNVEVAIASCFNKAFGATVALGSIKKNEVAIYTDKPIAYTEGDLFVLSVENENKDVAIYELVTWKGQEYVLKAVDILDKKLNDKLGQAISCDYVLSRYVEPLRNYKKDNSEFSKVAAANKLMNLISR